MRTILRVALVCGVALGLLAVHGLPGSAPVQAQQSFNNLVAGTNVTSTTPEELAGPLLIIEVLVQNDPDNTVDIFVGDSSSQPIQLAPGQSVNVPTGDISRVWIVAASATPTVNFLARR
jgi:hypothetical protein